MNRRLSIILFVVFTNIVGAGVVIPTLPLYAQGKFNSSAFEIALFVALFHFAQFFGAPILGQLSDKFGRRPVLIWSQLGTIFSFVLFFLADPIDGYIKQHLALEQIGGIGVGLFILYVARVLDGITGGNITAAQAYISDITTEKERAHAFGYIQTAFAIGLVFGPAFGGLLANINLTAPFAGAIAITSLSVIATILFLNESLTAEKQQAVHKSRPRLWTTWKHYLGNTTVLLLLSLSFAVVFVMAALSAIFALFASREIFVGLDDASVARNVGYIMALMGVTAVFSQVVLLKPLVRRFGEPNVIIISVISASVSCISLSYFSSPLWITLALLPAAFSYATGIPAGQALLIRFGNEQTHGQLIGLYHATNSLAYFIGPLIGGYLFDRFSPRMPFIASATLVGLGLALAFSLKSRTLSPTLTISSEEPY